MFGDFDAELGEFLRDPLGITIRDLAFGKFGPNR
jgi:hypothetical protein